MAKQTFTNTAIPFSFGNDKKKFASPVYFNMREALYAPSFSMEKSDIENMTVGMEMAVGRALYQLGRQARDMARAAAPKRTGALRAGIYVTGPASEANIRSFRRGDTVKVGEMPGMSSAYYRSINAAAKKREILVPGSEQAKTEGDQGGEFVNSRTQRLRPGVKTFNQMFDSVAGIDDDVKKFTDLSKFYQAGNGMLPFNPLGAAKRASFYVGIGSSMFYSAWVEYGNSKFKGRAFFTPAAEWMARKAPSAVKKAMREFQPAKAKPRKVITVK